MTVYKILLDTGVCSQDMADPAGGIRLNVSPTRDPNTNRLFVYIGKENLQPVSEERRQTAWLPVHALGQAAREGKVLLYTSSALRMESLDGYQGMRVNWSPFHAFDSVEIGHIEEPINLNPVLWDVDIASRVRAKQTKTKDERKKEKLSFWRWLADIDVNTFRTRVERSGGTFKPEEFHLLLEYQSWCRKIAPTHHDDAYHYFTAEYSKCDFFVSFNTKFLNAMKTASRSLGHVPSCQLVTPIELAGLLKLDTAGVVLPEVGMGYFLGSKTNKQRLEDLVPDGDWRGRIVSSQKAG